MESSDPELKPFIPVKNEFTLTSDLLLLKNNKLIIPQSLRDKAVSLAHTKHQDIVKTKKLVRENIWLPGRDKAVETVIQNCIYCQAALSTFNIILQSMSLLPHDAWTELSFDLLGPYPNGEYLLVIIDKYSRYPLVEMIQSTEAFTVIPVLERIFFMFGIPKSLKSDNGPLPFNSHAFKQFVIQLGFKHRKVTPLWPRSHAECEFFMKTFYKTTQIFQT